ncbi:MAG TPA: glutathione synthase [Gammaproteobacteria bacterium]|nr:glutathione synthase [Gammaproteobacteria bacterium]
MPKIAFLMDPIETVSVKKDSTLAMIAAAQQRGLEIFYLQQDGLVLSAGIVTALTCALRLRDDFCATLDPKTAGDDWYALGDEQAVALAEMDIVMMRKDPPFDMEYIYTTYLLERAEAEGVMVVNRPSALRDCNEKLFATLFPQCCPELIVSRRMDQLKAFHKQHANVVFKKLDGMGGASIFRVMEQDPNLSVVLETLTNSGREQIMGQVYLPEIVDGDKRILLINGEPVPYALARIPSAGETRGNLAAGGRGEGRPLTDRDQWIAQQIGPELKRRGLMFVGIDVIGDYLTEINVTCPTCIRELNEQFNLDIAGDLIDTCLQQLENS